jgi:hypothetical protein
MTFHVVWLEEEAAIRNNFSFIGDDGLIAASSFHPPNKLNVISSEARNPSSIS